MATDLGKAFVQIVPSAKGIQGSITKELKGESESAGKESGKSLGSSMISTFAKVIAAAGVGKVIGDAVLAGGDLQQSIGGIETLFGAGGRSVEEYAKSVGKSVKSAEGEYNKLISAQESVIGYANNAYKTAGVSANDYMQSVTGFSASLLQGLGGDTAAAAEVAHTAMVDMSDNANKMGTDMGSIQTAYQGFAKQNYTMLDNLKLGYGGTKTEMERLLKDAEAFSGVKYDINNLADVYNAIHVIQEEMGITGTTAKEATETFSGSLGMLKASWTNLMAAMATGQDWGAALGGVVESIVTFAKNAVPMVAAVVSDLPLMAISILQESGPSLLAVVGEAITGIIATWGARMPEMMTALTEAILLLIQSLVAQLPAMIQGAASLFSGIAQGITESVPIIVEQLPILIDSIISAILENLPLLIESGIALFSALVTNLPAIIEAIIAVIPSIIDGILEAIDILVPMIVDAGVQLLTALVEDLPGIITAIVDVLPGIIDSIITTLIDNIQLIIDAGVKLITALVDNLPEIINTIVDALPKIIDAILKAILENIPLLVESGITLLTALIDDLPTIIMTIVDALPQIIDSICNTLLDNMDLIVEAGVTLLVAILGDLPLIISKLVAKIPEIITGLVNALKGGVSKFKDVGVQLLTGLGNGIASAVGNVVAKAKEAASNIVNGVKNFFGIKSPSRVFFGIGEMLDQGMADGITDNMKPVAKAMANMQELTSGTMQSEVQITTSGMLAQRKLNDELAYSLSGTNRNTQPVVLSLILNGREVAKAIIDDINSLQNSELQMQLAY